MKHSINYKVCKTIKHFTLALTIIAVPILVLCSCLNIKFPDSYTITEKNEITAGSFFSIKESPKSTFTSNLTSAKNRYPARVLLLNCIPIKEVQVNIIDEARAIPCGTPFGIKIFTEGVLVVALSDVKTTNGTSNPAKNAGIKKGDVIISVNNTAVHSNEEMAKIVEKSNGDLLDIHVKRTDSEFDTTLQPIKSEQDNTYKVGMWVRDSSAGIGMLTFFDPQSKIFAGLGHGICDIDTQELLPLSHGEIVNASITGIRAGKRGIPGELRGKFDSNKSIGTLSQNTNFGVYGTFTASPTHINESLPIAMKHQIKPGPAQVITSISDNTPQIYNLNIVSINYDHKSPTKNMIIEITDEKLLSQTGGIVQGMSGSPIICDGKIIGAVTHVFVNNPKRGYAIFAETMLQNCKNISIDPTPNAA